jgi:putative integral membrane protein (TIGR02587 family)
VSEQRQAGVDTTPTRTTGQWRDVGSDLVRAFSGGMIFGVPLLYTMEVWHLGANTSPPRLLAGLLLAVILVFFLVRIQGFWSMPARRFVDALVQTVQAVGIALVSVALVLLVLRQLTWPMPLADAAGRIIVEAAPFAVGAGIASAAVRGSADDMPEQHARQADRQVARSTMQDVGATAIGALFIGLSIAPTDEIPTLAAAVAAPWLLGIMALSLLISYTIVFASGFLDEHKRRSQLGLLQRPVTETLAAYLVALAVSAAMLWYFENIAFDAPLDETLSRVLILGLPAAVGGSAGRLVV